MAPRSSTVARVSRKASAVSGMCLRKRPKMPIANAMSVAIGMVSPAMEPPFMVRLTARYTAIGSTMPPSAAMQGRSACLNDFRDPSVSSLLSSRPTLKKKKVIRPSLIHARTVRAWWPMCGPMGVFQSMIQRLEMWGSVFASQSDMTPAVISAALRAPPSSSKLSLWSGLIFAFMALSSSSVITCSTSSAGAWITGLGATAAGAGGATATGFLKATVRMGMGAGGLAWTCFSIS
mmetsp:Transcript_34387/g.102148  ORF Transcript_34387/g.102148 Transcript_34387/m.102148 type:complete len:234 (+) Transcript_34387:850-1551(+)